MTIGNSKLTTKMQFYRLFKTKDVSKEDIDIKPGQLMTFKVTVVDDRLVKMVNP